MKVEGNLVLLSPTEPDERRLAEMLGVPKEWNDGGAYRRPNPNSRSQRRAAIRILSARQNNRCAHCGVEVILPEDPRYQKREYLGLRATRDHVIPSSKGGGDELDNLVMACHDCNVERGNRNAFVFQCEKRGAHDSMATPELLHHQRRSYALTVRYIDRLLELRTMINERLYEARIREKDLKSCI